MSLSVRWHRLDAARWVHRLLVLGVVVGALASVVTLFAGWALGAPLLFLVPLALTALTGWIAHAWDDERRWTWWVLVVVAVLALGSDLLHVTAGVSFLPVARLLVDVVLLVLLVHPDSTARLHHGAADTARHGAGSGLRGPGRP